MSNQYQKAIEKALEASSLENIPAELRKKAFEVILHHELEGSGNNTKKTSPTGQKDDKRNTVDKKFNQWEKEIIDNLPNAAIAAKGNRSQQTMWAVIKLYSCKELANRESVPKVIKDDLGKTPQNGNNTSKTLKKLFPQFLSRDKDGKGYNYEPNRNSLEVFEGLE